MYTELNLVKIEILKKFLTQADFAAHMGIRESVVSQVLRGRKKLLPEDADRWVKVLMCDPDILVPVTIEN